MFLRFLCHLISQHRSEPSPGARTGFCMASVTFHCNLGSSSFSLQLIQVPWADSNSGFCGHLWRCQTMLNENVGESASLENILTNEIQHKQRLVNRQAAFPFSSLNPKLFSHIVVLHISPKSRSMSWRKLSNSSSCACLSLLLPHFPFPPSFGVKVPRKY